MKSTISIGTQDFVFLRENHCFFVDKTDLIREWWENKDAVTLITRPRRFGKTLNFSMMESFFSVEYEKREDLFEGLQIWNNKKYQDIQGTYPVIFFSFAAIKGVTYEAAREGIIQSLIRLYTKYAWLRNCEFMSEQDQQFFDSVNLDMTDTTAALSVNALCDYLSRYYGKKVLIFLDEYDTPLQEAYTYGFWQQLVEFMRGLFNATFKTNPYMERGLLTGITRVSKESIFSDLNNLTVVTTTSSKYETQFGFTQDEVTKSLKQYDLYDEQQKVKEWYDGFSFGNQTDIYNPWSITCFLEEKRYKPYWANTSSNGLVSKLIREGNAQIKATMEDLLYGKEFITEIDEEIIFEQLGKKKNAIWSLLLASGYLKVTNLVTDERTGRFIYHLRLTNQEVCMMFENMITDWFNDDEIPYNEFVKALLCNDVTGMNHYINEVSMETMSFFDTGKKESHAVRPERFYHGFVLGLIVELRGRYKINSNRESGYGRYDVMLEPLEKNDPAYIFEFKVKEKEEKDLEETAQRVLKQIEEKRYEQELYAKGVEEERIFRYGFAFSGKDVLIKKF